MLYVHGYYIHLARADALAEARVGDEDHRAESWLALDGEDPAYERRKAAAALARGDPHRPALDEREQIAPLRLQLRRLSRRARARPLLRHEAARVEAAREVEVERLLDRLHVEVAAVEHLGGGGDARAVDADRGRARSELSLLGQKRIF